jgi:uncharacterized membrane protein YdjX (TVP38/TMEM64 family)
MPAPASLYPAFVTNPEQPTPPAPGPAAPRFWHVVQRLGPAGVLGVLWASLPALFGFLLLGYGRTISAWLKSHGDAEGLVVFIAGFIVLAGLGLLPTYAQAILAGFAFGPVWGFVAAISGFTGASILGYGVARFVTRRRVEDVIAESPKAKAIADALVHRSALRTFGMVTLVRLPPNSPFAITNLVLAGLRIPPATFVGATMLGMAPRTFVAVYFGSQLQEWTGREKPPVFVIIAGFVLTAIVLGVIGVIAQGALKRMTAGQRSDAAPATEPGDGA